MTVDHVGYIMFPNQLWMRIVGRAAFPIFAFLIAQGFIHTKDVYKYLTRLSVFAVLIQLPFWFLDFFPNVVPFSINVPLNIFFTLALGLALLIILEKEKQYYYLIPFIILFAMFANIDYGVYGLLAILVMYYFKGYTLLIGWTTLNLLFEFLREFGPSVFSRPGFGLDFTSIQVLSIYAGFIIVLYNKKQGPRMKYFFYLYYPIHILVIYFIDSFIWYWIQ